MSINLAYSAFYQEWLMSIQDNMRRDAYLFNIHIFSVGEFIGLDKTISSLVLAS